MAKMIRLRASSTDRTYVCPGWYTAAERLPPRPDVTNPAAQSGIDLHEGIAAAIEQECSAYDLGFDGRDAFIVNEFARRVRTVAFERLSNEEYGIELYMKAARYPWHGSTDFCFLGTHRDTGKRIAGVIDYKTGRAPQPEAWKHLQLRNYGVLWGKELRSSSDPVEFEEMELWLFAAGNAPEKRYTVTTLSPEQLVQAEKDMRKIASTAKKAEAKRVPGIHQCKWCPCGGKPDACPESCMAIAKLSIPETGAITTPADVTELLWKWKHVKELGAKLEQWAIGKIDEDENIIPGWRTTPGRTTKVITNTTDAFFKLKGTLDADPVEAANLFAECTSVSFTKITDMLHARIKPTNPKFTKKAAEKLVVETLGNTMTFTTARPSLAPAKEETS